MVHFTSDEASSDVGCLGVALVTEHPPAAHELRVLVLLHAVSVGDGPDMSIEVPQLVLDSRFYELDRENLTSVLVTVDFLEVPVVPVELKMATSFF